MKSSARDPTRERERESEKEKKERKVEVELSFCGEEQEEEGRKTFTNTPRKRARACVSVNSCEVLAKQSSCLLIRRRNPECAEPESTVTCVLKVIVPFFSLSLSNTYKRSQRAFGVNIQKVLSP